jgi:hypothetical protein
MKRKLFGISATLAVLLAFGLVLASCGDDDGGGGDGDDAVTFTLTKIAANTFTLAVSGADWTQTNGTTLLTEDTNATELEKTATYLIRSDDLKDTSNDSADLTWTFIPATKTLMAVNGETLKGQLEFKNVGASGQYVTTGGNSANYVAVPAEGISFDE